MRIGVKGVGVGEDTALIFVEIEKKKNKRRKQLHIFYNNKHFFIVCDLKVFFSILNFLFIL